MSLKRINQPFPEPGAPPPAAVGNGIRFRLGFVYVGFLLFFGFIAFRLVQLQVLDNPELQQLAQRQFEKVGKIAPHRLAIYDRNREELAVSVPASSVFARPRLISAKRRTSRALAKVLGGTPAKWLARLDTQKPFVWIQRQIPEDVARELVRHNLAGIFVEPEAKRVYPSGSLAAHLLGFTDIDGNGLSGMELALNQELLRKESKFPLPRDGKGTPSYIDKKYFRPDDGQTGVYATIDRRLQNALEEELERAMEDTGAKSVIAIVMDPFTGEILALGQRPVFDPNQASQYPAGLFTNQAISHLFEPGSTMKVLFAAEAMQQGIMTPRTLIDCENGKMQIGKKTVSEAESDHKYRLISLDKVIRYSSNVGAVKVAQALGTDRVRATLDKFGLTSKTGVSLPGEVTSSPKGDKSWVPLFLATVGFGQGISVTPLQMVASFAPFANGGYLVRPRILLRESASPDRLEVRRVLSPSTVQAMKDMLVSVTEEKGGTGELARIPGIRIAGKTGTAQKYEGGAGYDGRKYFSSFIGFLPANEPELLVGVMVDEPKWPYYASQVAAPLFRRVAERSLQILGRVPKRVVAQSESRATPISELAPLPPVSLGEVSEGKWMMPDLRGLPMREALRAVGRHLDHVKVIGSGYVDSQAPKPGTIVSSQSSVVLNFSPQG